MTHCSRLTQVGQACLRNRKRAQKSARGKLYKVIAEAIIYYYSDTKFHTKLYTESMSCTLNS